MFYWHGENKLERELLSCESLKNIKIATAFISNTGVSILKKMQLQYQLSKQNIIVYLSDKFSVDKPHKILEDLREICTVKIIFDYNFHSKVYFMKGKGNSADKLIYGSSNFTSGGMYNNIEFDYIGVPNAEDVERLNLFFTRCESISVNVTDDIIDYYKENESEILKLKNVQKKLSKTLSGYITKDDPFTEDTYDIDDYYFNFNDYEIFFPRNSKRDDEIIQKRRKNIQDKMLAIHNQIYPTIRKMGINCHKKEDNITSMIKPSMFNKFSVDWLGVRYGKTQREIELINSGIKKGDEEYAFHRNGCLQYSIGAEQFDINLFLAVKHNAVDRSYLHENLKRLKPDIISELEKLRGYGMQWVITKSYDDTQRFDIDIESPTSFCDFFSKYDADGCESLLQNTYAPDNEILKNIDTICDEVTEKVKLMLPLYNTIVWRPDKSNL